MKTSFSAENGPERVGGQTLVNTSIFFLIELADSKVPSRDAVSRARLRRNEAVVHFPPIKHRGKLAESEWRVWST